MIIARYQGRRRTIKRESDGSGVVALPLVWSDDFDPRWSEWSSPPQFNLVCMALKIPHRFESAGTNRPNLQKALKRK